MMRIARYLVDNKWFKQWRKYVGYDNWDTGVVGERTSHPGPVDNASLLKSPQGELKDHLIDDLDYILVPQEAWALLEAWYGLAPGQSPIERRVIEYGMFVKHCRVEIYFMELKLCQMSDMENPVTRKFSKMDTLEQVEKVMKEIFNIPEEAETRLWNKYNNSTIEKIDNKTVTLQEAGIYQSVSLLEGHSTSVHVVQTMIIMIIIEQKTPDGTWPKRTKSTSTSSTATSNGGDACGGGYQPSSITTRSFGNNVGNVTYCDYQESTAVGAGLCGLANLGNTCFMNSALQCMSNTPLLTQYFLKDSYWDELNIDNPLGMHGEIAKSYGELVKVIWSGQFAYTIPRNFKMVVGRFAPQFSGYQQQDCQELMAFLLDGLHEDLNRVKRKPYVEVKDADGRPDKVVALEAWENYLKRNNSIIVDIFHGLLKSTLVCPVCSKVSVTFDPFCYLSLPLPIRKERLLEFLFVPLAPERRPQQMKVSVPKLGTVADLCEAASRLTSVPADRLQVTDVYSCRFHKVFQGDELLNSILDRDEIFIYELPPSSEPLIAVPIYMRDSSSSKSHGRNNIPQLFGQPFLIAVPEKEVSYTAIYNTILQRMARFVTSPDPNDNWWITSPPENTEQYNGDMMPDVEMSNGGGGEEGEEDEGEMEEDEDETGAGDSRRMFTISGLRLNPRTYLAIDWHPCAKLRFYDDKEAKEYEVHESMHQQRVPHKKSVVGLSECLELFTTTERLGVEDPWFCPACRKHQQATKKFDLWSLPRVLIIHLKRFSYNRYWRDKLDTMVDFPVRGLDMSRYVINQEHGPAVYDLIAVANHYGGMGGGHYTAYAKNSHTGKWFYFDDSSVSSASEDSLATKAAYVLFYQLREEGADDEERPMEVNNTSPSPSSSPEPSAI
ncbi:USP15 [Cordylochernes scorpioides]|uniref:Ubiquitin carboxyl-terminal hydrolase n=1 Tax=Cordylochernes scorpioides TaxID=51811 RepID=A0ABY6KKF9_9ARAC|nr:USP15 [Cordylochernes scorpioides]